MARGDGGDQRLLGIDPGRVGHRHRHDVGGGGGGHRGAAVETPFVPPAVASRGELPSDCQLISATCLLIGAKPSAGREALPVVREEIGAVGLAFAGTRVGLDRGGDEHRRGRRQRLAAGEPPVDLGAGDADRVVA